MSTDRGRDPPRSVTSGTARGYRAASCGIARPSTTAPCAICALLTRWWSTRRCTQTAQRLYAPVCTCRPTGVATPLHTPLWGGGWGCCLLGQRAPQPATAPVRRIDQPINAPNYNYNRTATITITTLQYEPHPLNNSTFSSHQLKAAFDLVIQRTLTEQTLGQRHYKIPVIPLKIPAKKLKIPVKKTQNTGQTSDNHQS